MRIIKLFEEFNYSEIEYICREYNITNFHINRDSTVDVNGGVDLSSQGLDRLPLVFNKVSGYFDCTHNRLTTLEGCPKEVGGAFSCDRNLIKSLEYAPVIAGSDFSCSHNDLTSLEGAPKKVIGDFDCVYNKLMSLRGCPLSIGGDFYCNGNPVYEIWKLIYEEEYLELFLDYDMIEGDELNLLKLNDILKMIGKKPVKSVKGYKCI